MELDCRSRGSILAQFSPFQLLTPFSTVRPTTYANGFTLWHYTSPNAPRTVLSPDYFNDASDMLRAGDFIFCNLNTGEIPCHGQLVVKSSSNGRVEVAEPATFRTSVEVAA